MDLVIIGCIIIFLVGVLVGYCVPKPGCQHRWGPWHIVTIHGERMQMRSCLHTPCQKVKVVPVT